jgi:glycosyltransferase involved in cell wall biosynthesis
MRLRRRPRYQAILLAHETSLSAAYHWKTREFELVGLAAVQVAQFAVLTACFDSVIFSNESTQRAWVQLMPPLAKRFHTTRICSNIPHHFSVDPTQELLAAGYSVHSPTILFFGTGHEAVLFAYLDAAFRALSELEPRARLVIVGMSPEKLREVRPTLADLGDRVQALGYVAAPQVSLWLQVATMVLAPLVEGVSARKGTVMAALQHGQAVVTTRGANTLDDIAWNEICFLSRLDQDAFTEAAIEAFQSPERRAALGRSARAEYEANASAAVTAARILDHARLARDTGIATTRS